MRYPAVYQETILTRHRMWISVVTRIGGIIEIGISDNPLVLRDTAIVFIFRNDVATDVLFG